MSEPVLDSDITIYKNVRFKDIEDVGNVFAITGDRLIIREVKAENMIFQNQTLKDSTGVKCF